MRTNLGKKLYFFPLPVVVIGSYDKNNKPNAMTAAWATIYDFNQIFVSIALEHKTANNIKLNKAFTIAFATKETAQIADYVGLVSGKKQPNKVAKAGLKVIKGKVNAPIFTNFPLTVECKLVSIDGGNLIGDIININVDNKYLNKNKKLDIDKMNLISYDTASHSYRLIGKKIATAFKVGLKLK